MVIFSVSREGPVISMVMEPQVNVALGPNSSVSLYQAQDLNAHHIYAIDRSPKILYSVGTYLKSVCWL